MTLNEELSKVAAGVQDQITEQLHPDMRSLVIVGAPTGEFVVAHSFERERLVKVLQRALDSAKGGAKQGSGLLWLPPGVRA